tara:strand:+ start:211 stop:432 length:222 start_codon:yes stop_codon:yes gene_type:complete
MIDWLHTYSPQGAKMSITQELFESLSVAVALDIQGRVPPQAVSIEDTLAELERQADAVDRIQAMATTDTEEQS